jgi:hypothetical protein
MHGKPVQFERLDMGQRGGAGQPRNIGDGCTGAEIEKDALAFEAPYPTLRQLNLDHPGRNETALPENEFQTIGRKPRPVDRD